MELLVSMQQHLLIEIHLKATTHRWSDISYLLYQCARCRLLKGGNPHDSGITTFSIATTDDDSHTN